jgi:hypothetical protein
MNNKDITIGNTAKIIFDPDKWSGKQRQRAEMLCERMRPAYEKIKAGHICNFKNMEKVLGISRDISFMNVRNHERYNDYKALKPFDTHLKNLILNYVVYCSAAGEILYKEKLAKKVKASHKTVVKIVNDLVKCGAFIKMAPHTNPNLDKRIINIRPSVDVTVAFIDYNIRSMINSMKFISSYTKVKLKFEFDYNDQVVV